MIKDEYLWVEKYRPKTIDECILPERIKEKFKAIVKDGNIPNLLLPGSAGIGKTTVVKALANELDADVMVVNGSLNAGIDTLRYDIMQFASSVSFTGGRKLVLLDEADYLSGTVQAALRNFMEEYSKNCGFALTCNFANKIIEPLHSRCSAIPFRIEKNERPEIAKQFMDRSIYILEAEGITYDKKVLAELIMKFMPDWRKVINELQKYALTGSIDSGILKSFSDDSFKSLIGHMKNKNYTEVRKWIGENQDLDTATIFRLFHDQASEMMVPSFHLLDHRRVQIS